MPQFQEVRDGLAGNLRGKNELRARAFRVGLAPANALSCGQWRWQACDILQTQGSRWQIFRRAPYPAWRVPH